MPTAKVHIPSTESAVLLVHAHCNTVHQHVAIEKDDTKAVTLILDDGSVIEGTNTVAVHLASLHGQGLTGESQADGAEIHQWLAGSVDASEHAALAKRINEHLASRTFLVSNHLTVADIVVYARLHAFMASLNAQRRFAMNDFSRWFNHIQNTLPLAALQAAGLAHIDIDLNAPKPAAPVKADKKGKKGDAPAEVAPAADADKDKQKTKKEKKDKKEKKADKAEKKVEAAPATDSGPVISQIDLRVGRIVDCQKHENAEALYVEKIDVGEAEPRVVISGLVRFVPLEQMQNREVIVMCNLKPVSMRGIKSFGMVMCATSPDGETVEPLSPPAGARPGDRVYFEGFRDGEPDAQLNPKKKIFEAFKPGMKTNDQKVATWESPEGNVHVMHAVDLGAVVSQSIASGQIS